MRTTVVLPDDLYRRLKSRAALRGMKVRELMTSYIERGLLEIPERGAPGRSDPPVIVPPSGVPIPALSRDELALIDEEEERASRRRSPRR
jgi:hypothetical protein